MKITEFFKSNKVIFSDKQTDFLNIVILTTIFLCLCIITWGKMGDPIIDCGREAYVPLEILRGKVFIRDIFVLFTPNPMSFQINAFLYKIFGINLSVLYIAGSFCAYLILLLTYFIAKVLFKPLTTFAIAFSVMPFGIFRIHLANYIFPYSYASVYAALGLLMSVFLSIYAIKNKENNKFNIFMYSAFLSMGFSLANKLDYSFIVLLMCLIPLFLKKFRVKHYIYSFIFLITCPLISFSIPFIQGLSFNEFSDYMIIGKNYFNSEAMKCFYRHFCYFDYSPIRYIRLLLGSFACFFTVFYVYYKITNVCYNNPLKFKNVLLVITLIIFNATLLHSIIVFSKSAYLLNFIFCWFTPISILLVSMYYIANSRFKNIIKTDIELISVFIVFSAILAISKTFFFIYLDLYCTYSISLILISLFIIFLRYFPKIIPIKDEEKWKDLISISFILVSLTFLTANITYKLHFKYPINSTKGTLYASDTKSYITNKTLEYIKIYVPENAVCLILPEGAMINFLSGRKSLDKYYHLIPNHVETLGEENIIKDLKSNPPDFIFIGNRTNPEYGKEGFCTDYANKICEFIKSNYELKKTFQSAEKAIWDSSGIFTQMKIYKLK